MLVRSIAVSNFKSFRNMEIDQLGRFNVLIGTNASGKTNFIQIFRFLRDIADHGLANAISLQGGPDFLRNTNLKQDEECSIRIAYDPDLSVSRKRNGRFFKIRYPEIVYEFSFRFPDGEGIRITKDRLTKKLELSDAGVSGAPVTGESILSSQDGNVHYELKAPSDFPLRETDIVPEFLRDEGLEKNALLLETPYFGFAHRLDRLFDRLAIYDFDPKLPKHSIPITGKTDLEEDGSNLAICLKGIFEDRERKRKFSNLVKDLLPFIEEIEIEKTDRSLHFKLKDKYSGGSFVPSSFISDGTLNMIAVIVALYFEKKSLIIIEEPERSIHPRLITKLVAMMQEVSDRKQIIVTTHHPDIVRLADPKNILFSTRDKDGFSTICRPIEREETRAFLEKELGIEDLFKQDLLGL